MVKLDRRSPLVGMRNKKDKAEAACLLHCMHHESPGDHELKMRQRSVCIVFTGVTCSGHNENTIDCRNALVRWTFALFIVAQAFYSNGGVYSRICKQRFTNPCGSQR